MTYITTTSTVGQLAAATPQTTITNGTNSPDVSTQSLVNNSSHNPAVQAAQLSQSTQPKTNVGFSNAAGDWHMEFYHPETGEVVERFPAKQVANIYQSSTRSRG